MTESSDHSDFKQPMRGPTTHSKTAEPNSSRSGARVEALFAVQRRLLRVECSAGLPSAAVRSLVLLALSGILAGCSRADTAGEIGFGDGPIIEEVFSLELDEPDSAFVGQPVDLAIHTDGSLLVADGISSRVLRFDRSGRLIQVLGGPGDGPGEIGSPTAVFSWDSLIVVGHGGGRLTMFDEDSGEETGRVQLEGTPIAGGQVIEGRAWIGVQSAHRGTIAAVMQDPDGPARYVGSLPPSYMEQGLNVFSNVAIAEAAGRVFMGASAAPDLQILDVSGEPVGVLEVPVRRRRGIPSGVRDEVERLLSEGRSRLEAASSLQLAFSVGDEWIGLVHYDYENSDLENWVLPANVYVSLISTDGRSGCLDRLLFPAVEGDPVPRMTARGDTIFAAFQTFPEPDQVRTVITGFVVDGDSCQPARIDHAGAAPHAAASYADQQSRTRKRSR